MLQLPRTFSMSLKTPEDINIELKLDEIRFGKNNQPVNEGDGMRILRVLISVSNPSYLVYEL